MNRIDYLDIAKGIGIILVYIGHCHIGERTQTLSKCNLLDLFFSHAFFLFCFRNVILPQKERISQFHLE